MPNPTRLLILGANGRLGRCLTRVFGAEPAFAVASWGRAELDLCRIDQIAPALDAADFDVLINAAGLTGVDDCERRPEEARLANADGPAELARHCARHGRRLIHVSTDYVFSGEGREPLNEEAPPAPCNVYGRTKLDGERAVLDIAPGQALVTRISWLFGRDKGGFPDMILENALRSPEVSAVADKWSSPTLADDLADWLRLLLLRHPEARGLLHLCNAGAPSWQEYGQAVLDAAARRGFPLRTRQVAGVSMEGFAPFLAKRPPFTAMTTEKFTSITEERPRPWLEALEDWLAAKSLPG
jgi:dTDP-4-dehydrorhamnose reductase